jgi:uncharacterized membrane protein YfcA
MSIELVAAGLLVGFLIGATGIGGGILMAPILLFLGIQPSVVVGSDLFYGFITKCLGTVQHYRQGSVNSSWIKALGSGSVFGAVFGVIVIRLLFHHYGAEFTNIFVKKALAIVLVFASTLLLLGEVFLQKLRDKLNICQIDDPRRSWLLVASFGLVIGFIVGMTSIGSGSVIALFFLLFSAMTPKDVVGTDIAHAVLLSGVATIGHMTLGTVDLKLTMNLLAGSLPGVLVGGYMTILIPSRPLKLGIGFMILMSGLRGLA